MHKEKIENRFKIPWKKMSTITLTFGDRCENHNGMQIIGQSTKGFSKRDIMRIHKEFSNSKIYYLHRLIEDPENHEKAYLLVIRNFLNTSALKEEIEPLNWDTKVYMRGAVKNKHARYNLCFSDFNQEPDYENKKGRVYDFNELENLKKLREDILKICNLDTIECEGNYYYDLKKTYIGYHGDTERNIVVGLRIGESMPLYYKWYHNFKQISPEHEIELNDGDLYIMSEKASGNDWKKSSLRTLRHAAGFKNVLDKVSKK